MPRGTPCEPRLAVADGLRWVPFEVDMEGLRSASTVGWRNCFSPIRSTGAVTRAAAYASRRDSALLSFCPAIPPADSGVEPVHSAPLVLRTDGKSTRPRSLSPDRIRSHRRPISGASHLGFVSSDA